MNKMIPFRTGLDTRIKSVWNKKQNHYYYNIFFEKALYKLPENNNNK